MPTAFDSGSDIDSNGYRRVYPARPNSKPNFKGHTVRFLGGLRKGKKGRSPSSTTSARHTVEERGRGRQRSRERRGRNGTRTRNKSRDSRRKMDRYEARTRNPDNGRRQCMNLVQGHDRTGRAVYYDLADPRGGRRGIRMCRHGEYPQACGRCEREKADREWRRRNQDVDKDEDEDDYEYVYRDHEMDRRRGRGRSQSRDRGRSRNRSRGRSRGRGRTRERSRSLSTRGRSRSSTNSSGRITTYDGDDNNEEEREHEEWTWPRRRTPARHHYWGDCRRDHRDRSEDWRTTWWWWWWPTTTRDHGGERGWGRRRRRRHPACGGDEKIQIREKEIEYDDGTSEIRVYAFRDGEEEERRGRCRDGHGRGQNRHYFTVDGFGGYGDDRDDKRDLERQRRRAEWYMNDIKEAARLQKRAAANAEWLNRHYGG